MPASDIKRLANDLRKGADKARDGVEGAVKKGAYKIKRDWSKNVRLRAVVHGRALPSAINYDDTGTGDGLHTAEIGYDKRKNQGPLGNLLEYGAPQRDTEAGQEGDQALNREAPNLVRSIRDLANPLG